MSLTAKVDITTTPYTLTVTSDRRHVKGTTLVAGETATFDAVLEPVVKDDSGRVWTKKSDDGAVAVYTG